MRQNEDALFKEERENGRKGKGCLSLVINYPTNAPQQTATEKK